MGIAKDLIAGNRYVETFFSEQSDKYVKGQLVVPVKTFRLYDANGDVIIEDKFD